MVLPITILLFSASVILLLNFYMDLREQIHVHELAREEVYESSEVLILRARDSAERLAEEAGL